METRAEHIAWCKERALEYVEIGDMNQAFASMSSDLKKHEETKNHPDIMIGFKMLMSGELNNPARMRHFINEIE